jgi:ArsR family transcriptional regulator, arsenate/arsenite/antimonite-responsive transcriptional repressor
MAKKATFNKEVVSDLAQAFRLLSDETRLKIVFYLAKSERNVGSLCDILGLAQPTVSHHLGLLRMGRLIVNRRNGKQVIYSLNKDMMARIRTQMNSCVSNLSSLLKGK